MRDVAVESVAASLVFVTEVMAMALLTLIGLLAEATAVARFGAGVDPLTLWYVFVGGLALYAGTYMLGYRRIVPRIRHAFTDIGGAR